MARINHGEIVQALEESIADCKRTIITSMGDDIVEFDSLTTKGEIRYAQMKLREMSAYIKAIEALNGMMR
jgi:DNA replication protein DnaD